MTYLVAFLDWDFFHAGIYPAGMKIASDYFQKELGKSLGLLVCDLVLGTAFPYLIKSEVGSPMYWTFQFLGENYIELPIYWHHFVHP